MYDETLWNAEVLSGLTRLEMDEGLIVWSEHSDMDQCSRLIHHFDERKLFISLVIVVGIAHVIVKQVVVRKTTCCLSLQVWAMPNASTCCLAYCKIHPTIQQSL